MPLPRLSVSASPEDGSTSLAPSGIPLRHLLCAARGPYLTVAVEIEQAVHPDVRRLIAAHAETFPPGFCRDEVYNTVYVGPYVKYRWLVGKHTYCISLGLLGDFPFTLEGF